MCRKKVLAPPRTNTCRPDQANRSELDNGHVTINQTQFKTNDAFGRGPRVRDSLEDMRWPAPGLSRGGDDGGEGNDSGEDDPSHV
jgi:hypothetical protein